MKGDLSNGVQQKPERCSIPTSLYPKLRKEIFAGQTLLALVYILKVNQAIVFRIVEKTIKIFLSFSSKLKKRHVV